MKNETLEVIFNVDSHTNTIYAHIISESIATSAPIFTQNLGLQIVTPLEAESMGTPATPQQYEGLKLYMEKKGFTIKVLNDPPHIRDFDSWQETHFEVVHAISAIISTDSYSNRIKQVQEDGGYGALYELAKTLTDQFQDDNEGRAWDGEFFDEIEEFLEKELK